MKILLKTMRINAYYSNRFSILKGLTLFRFMCLLSFFLLSCEKKNNYCSVYLNNNNIPKQEVFFLRDSMRVSFTNYWKNIDSLWKADNQSVCYFFEDFTDFYRFNPFTIHLSKHESIEAFEEFFYADFIVHGGNVDEDISREITQTINGINYKILLLINTPEVSLKAYGKYSDNFILDVSIGFYRPFQESLTQIENQKEELIDDLLNRLYCVLSTIEITSATLKSNDEKLD
jgi:hypothetical protein